MYERKGVVYAEPFKLLKKGNSVCFQSKGSLEDFIQINADITDMYKSGNYIFWGNDYCLLEIIPYKDYNYYKERLIKRRYSNDAQIAIMLNKDLDEDGQLLYERMQEWREWAGAVAKKIMETIN